MAGSLQISQMSMLMKKGDMLIMVTIIKFLFKGPLLIIACIATLTIGAIYCMAQSIQQLDSAIQTPSKAGNQTQAQDDEEETRRIWDEGLKPTRKRVNNPSTSRSYRYHRV